MRKKQIYLLVTYYTFPNYNLHNQLHHVGEIPCLMSLFLSTGLAPAAPSGYGAGCSACERGGQWLRALELADALEREVSRWGLRKGWMLSGWCPKRQMFVGL